MLNLYFKALKMHSFYFKNARQKMRVYASKTCAPKIFNLSFKFSLSIFLSLFFLISPCKLLSASMAQFPAWQNISLGLALSFMPLPNALLKQSNAPLTNIESTGLILLRIDPKFNELVLLMSSEHGNFFTLSEWAHEYELLAVTNASMYQQDGKKSIGLMRTKEHVNNPKISKRLGSFFVSDLLNPTEEGNKNLPAFDIIDRNQPNLEQHLAKYGTVLQNFRVLDPAGSTLWPSSGPVHSMSLLGKDNKGLLYIVFSRAPLNPSSVGEELRLNFANNSAEQGTKLEALMYLEGGREAGLALKQGAELQLWSGLPKQQFLGINPALLPSTPVPNVLGVRAKQ